MAPSKAKQARMSVKLVNHGHSLGPIPIPMKTTKESTKKKHEERMISQANRELGFASITHSPIRFQREDNGSHRSEKYDDSISVDSYDSDSSKDSNKSDLGFFMPSPPADLKEGLAWALNDTHGVELTSSINDTSDLDNYYSWRAIESDSEISRFEDYDESYKSSEESSVYESDDDNDYYASP